MCAEVKTDRVSLLTPFSIQMSSCVMSSGDASRIVQCNLRIFDSYRLPSIKNGCGFPRMLFNVTYIQFNLVMVQLLLQEGHALYWTSLTQLNQLRRERDIHSPVKNLSFLKMTPCPNTGEQHEQISVKLLNYSMY